MSYRTYTTEAFVCGAFDNNTADRSYLLFTRRAGMLYATARSVREERSKQRYALQLFSRISVSLVRGKSGWRIGSVEALENLFLEATHRAERGSLVSVIKLVRQFVHGEEMNDLLYDEVQSNLLFLAALATEEQRPVWETLSKARILFQLGYVAPPSEAVENLLTSPLSTLQLSEVLAQSVVCAELVATATDASHLALVPSRE